MLDVRVTLHDGTEIDIEMQNAEKKDMDKRLEFYTSRVYSKQIESGEMYANLKKVIGIAILNFDYFKDIEDYHTKWKMTEQKYKNAVLETKEMHFIELPKFMKSKIDIKDKLSQWLIFIENSRKGLVEMAKENNIKVEEAAAKYDYLTGDEAVQRLAYLRLKHDVDVRNELYYARKEGLEEGLAEGRTEGRIEGRATGERENKIKIAKKMKAKNMPIEEIIELTELSKEEIEKL